MVTSIERMEPNRLRIGIRFNGFGDKVCKYLDTVFISINYCNSTTQVTEYYKTIRLLHLARDINYSIHFCTFISVLDYSQYCAHTSHRQHRITVQFIIIDNQICQAYYLFDLKSKPVLITVFNCRITYPVSVI